MLVVVGKKPLRAEIYGAACQLVKTLSGHFRF